MWCPMLQFDCSRVYLLLPIFRMPYSVFQFMIPIFYMLVTSAGRFCLLTLEDPSKIAADDTFILIIFNLTFGENKVSYFT